MRLLKLVEMVSGQVGVVKTTYTIMSHTAEVFFAQFLGS
jgi:hypothetical protein